MNAAVLDDTTLSCMARFIMLWILRSPSEVINPDAIAQDNHIPVKTVKMLLAELVDHKYLVKPQRVNNPAKAGQFTWTPYTLNPYYGQPLHGQTIDGKKEDGDKPVRAETPSPKNPPMDTVANGVFVPVEYVSAAGEKESLLLKAKESVLLLDTESNNKQTNSLSLPPPANLNQGATAQDDSLATRFKLANPMVQAMALQAFIGANSHDAQEKPGELPTAIVKDYRDKFAYSPNKPETEALERLISCYGAAFVQDKISVAKLVDADGKRIQNPARYIELVLEKEAAKTASVKPVPAKQKTEHDAIFDRDPEQELNRLLNRDSSPPIQLNPEWQRLGWHIQNIAPNLHHFFAGCRFGGIEAGSLSVITRHETHREMCQIKLNHRGWFLQQCQDIWEELTSVEFVIEGVSHALPETP